MGRFRIFGFWFLVLGFGFRVLRRSSTRQRSRPSGRAQLLRVEGLRFRVRGSGFGSSEFRIDGLGFMASGFWFLCFWFLVSNFWFLVSGFGLVLRALRLKGSARGEIPPTPNP